MKGYLFLGAAILLEFFGTTCMKLSNGFSHALYTGGTLVCYGACFYFLALIVIGVVLCNFFGAKA